MFLNHFPLTGLLMALLFLLLTELNNSRAALLIALVAGWLPALFACPVAHYGERAYDRVLPVADEVGGQP